MVERLLHNDLLIKEYMRQYRVNNKDRIYQLQQKRYDCPHCGRLDIHIYYRPQHEKTKYCIKRKLKKESERTD